MNKLALAFISTKLVKNYQKNNTNIFYIHNSKFNFKIYIKYKNMMFNKNIKLLKKK